MSNIRVYELARDLNTTNKILLEKLDAMDIAVKSHMSALDEETVVKIRAALFGQKPASVEETRIRPTVIRRRKKVVKAEAAPEIAAEETAGDQEAAPELQSSEAETLEQAEPETGPAAEERPLQNRKAQLSWKSKRSRRPSQSRRPKPLNPKRLLCRRLNWRPPRRKHPLWNQSLKRRPKRKKT